jgi:hypothetical protein
LSRKHDRQQKGGRGDISHAHIDTASSGVVPKKAPFVSNLLKTAHLSKIILLELDALDFKVIFQQFLTFLAEISLAGSIFLQISHFTTWRRKFR